MSRKTQILCTFICGVIFLLMVVVIALRIPNPSGFQCGVFYIVLAVAAAGFAAFLPGTFVFEVPQFVRAGGALAVLVFTIYVTVLKGGICGVGPMPTDHFHIALSCQNEKSADVAFLEFQRSDVPTANFYDFVKPLAISQSNVIFNRDCGLADARFFRSNDETEIDSKNTVDALSANNTGIIGIPGNVASLFGSAHGAFVAINAGIQEHSANPLPFSVSP